MDDDPVQMITGAGLVFMAISPNSRITEFQPKWCWICDIVKGGHEADSVTKCGMREVIVGREQV